jgi:hypothetical protein
MWMESANKVYGRSNNAYNTNHTVGGSSGGEGTGYSSHHPRGPASTSREKRDGRCSFLCVVRRVHRVGCGSCLWRGL